MPFSIEYLAASLKNARIGKGLTQRELSSKVRIPQGHISKIEQGNVDLQISSLIELARSLDLEVMLIPRPLIAVVEAMQRNTSEDQPLYQIEQEEE